MAAARSRNALDGTFRPRLPHDDRQGFRSVWLACFTASRLVGLPATPADRSRTSPNRGRTPSRGQRTASRLGRRRCASPCWRDRSEPRLVQRPLARTTNQLAVQGLRDHNPRRVRSAEARSPIAIGSEVTMSCHAASISSNLRGLNLSREPRISTSPGRLEMSGASGFSATQPA